MRDIGKPYFVKNKKLVKKTTLAVALLVSAILVLSSSLTAIEIQGESENLNEKIHYVGRRISAAKDNIPGLEGIPQMTPAPEQPSDWIHFDNGVNDNSLGLTAGGTFEYGVRFTPMELTDYDGYLLTTVRHHHAWSGGAGPSVSGYVKIYDEGTASSPGTLLYQQAYTTGSVPGWEEYTLSSPVTIDGTKDLWLTLEVTHASGQYPAGMDPGPAVDGKGDWIYLSPGPWQEIQGLGFDNNWNLWAGLEEGGPGLQNDTGVTSIIAPVGGTATGPITPKANVKNFGTLDQTNVPVDMEITTYGTPTDYWCDGFECYTPGKYDFPPGWTVETTNPTGTWYMHSSSQTYSASTYPRIQEAGSDGNAQDESLISPTIDCSDLSWVHVQFTKYYYPYGTDYATFTLYGSIDDGVTWPYQLVQYTTTSSTTAENINITSWAAGESQVKFRFRYESPADATLNSYMYFDNFWVGQYQLFGPTGDNPPVGWTIENYPSAPPVWNNNYWHRHLSLYTSYDSMWYPARIYYLSPYEDVDCALITPSIDCSALDTVNLYINGYFYYYLTYSNGAIEISVDGGAWETVFEFTASKYHYEFDGYNNYDITSWAAGESDVKIRFRYYHTAANQGRYWYLSNVRVGSDRGNIIFYDSFQGETVYAHNFKFWQADDWCDWSWEQVSGINANNKWSNLVSGTLPTCTPYEGLRMAQYYSYSAPSGESARLYQKNPVDVSAASALKVGFMMFHDSGAGGDKIQVQYSIDGGTSWINTGEPILRNNNYAGWDYHVVDLPTVDSIQIGFLGMSAYGYNMYIDDVCIFDPGYITEYSETVYVSVAAGETVEAVFPSWTPDAWQTQEGFTVTYDVFATTDLAGDEKPSNDAKLETFQLYYPLFYDVEVLEILSPTSDGDAKPLPVKATITNVGQFAVRNFFVTAQIGSSIARSVQEDFSTAVVPNMPDGWQTNNAKWSTVNSANAGGTAPEARFYYSPSETGDFRMYCDPFNTVGQTEITLTFKHMVSHYTTPYTLKVETSTDGGATWSYTPWSITPTASISATTVTVPLTTAHGVGSAQFCISFTFSGYSWNINYWYVDNIVCGTLPPIVDAEYDESAAVASWLYPGEVRELNYPTWTPANLIDPQESGQIKYTINVENELSDNPLYPDGNPDNDIASETFRLKYWHDVKVKAITSPAIDERDPWDLLFSYNVETASGAVGNAGAEWDGTYFYSTRWASNLIHQYDSSGVLVKQFSIPGVTGLRDLAYNPNTGTFYGGAGAGTIWEMDFDSETLVRTLTGSFQSRAIAYNHDEDVIYCSNWADPVWVVDPLTGAINSQFNLGVATSTYGFAYDNTGTNKYLYAFDQGAGAGTAQYIYEWDLDAGAMTGFTYDVTVDFPTTAGIAGGLFTGPGFAPGVIVIGGLLQGTPDMMFVYELRAGGGGGGGYPPITVYTAPGTKAINAIVGNDGVFDELDLTCYVEVYHFADDPENGTFVYGNSVGDIDLDPLGGEEAVSLGSVNFNIEGPWGLWIEIPADPDDYPNNNIKALGIGVDDTPPISTHTLNPAAPNGEAGWYVTNVKITLQAEDPLVKDIASGVESIWYKLNDDAWKPYTGEITASKQGENVVKYYAKDNVGHQEAENSVTFNIDTVKPTIMLTKEKGLNKITFTAEVDDATSGVNRVEFFLNQGWVATDTEAPYEFVLSPVPNVEMTCTAVVYDEAGNFAEESVTFALVNSHSMPSNTVVRISRSVTTN